MYIDNKYDECVEILDDFISKNRGKSVIIFGMNNSAKIEISHFHRRNVNIYAIVDSNPNKQGMEWCGEIVKSPVNILTNDLGEDVVIAVSSKNYTDSIIDTLLKINPNCKDKIVKLELYKYLDAEFVLTDRSKLKKANLTDIQQENFRMLIWLYKLCKKNDIRCYFSYGTLLGAVRHAGFIPWDDDVDVSIPLPDYLRLHQVMQQEKEKEFEFESMLFDASDEVCISTIAKVKSKKLLVEERNFPLCAEDYLAIDIWPMSGYPKDEKESRDYYDELYQLGNEWKEKVVIPFGTNEFSQNVYYEMRTKLLKAMGRYNYDASDYVGEVYCGKLDHIRHDLARRGVRRDAFDNTIEKSFEDELVDVPSGYDIILRTKYQGDYMIPPAEAGKRTHNFSKAAFWKNDNDYYDRDTNYWNEYYKNKGISEPSQFAKKCSTYMHKGELLADLGCGNGRDSRYFDEMGLVVTAIDASQIAINTMVNNSQGKTIQYVCGDFVTWIEKKENHYDHCYSRFTLHALDEFQQEILIRNVYSALKKSGYFYIEVRGIHDDLFGLGKCVGKNAYVYNDHYRRFLVLEELVESLEKNNFKIVSAVEGKGFAPLGDSDPLIIRVVAQK